MKIFLVCSGGMSTSLLVEKMKKTALQEKLEYEIEAIPLTRLASVLATADCILVAPQIRHQFPGIQKAAESSAKPVAVIDAVSYGRIAGKEVLEQALQLMEGSR